MRIARRTANCAACPKCAERLTRNASLFDEDSHITARAEPGETFRAFVQRMRGGKPGTIKITRS
jgi:hypothetical protein